MDFSVAIGVLVLYHDDVATEVSLSRPRWSRQEVRVVTGAWLGKDISGHNKKLLCRYRISWGCVGTGYFLSRQSLDKIKGFHVTTKYLVS